MEPDENTQPEDLLWGLCCHEAGALIERRRLWRPQILRILRAHGIQ